MVCIKPGRERAGLCLILFYFFLALVELSLFSNSLTWMTTSTQLVSFAVLLISCVFEVSYNKNHGKGADPRGEFRG